MVCGSAWLQEHMNLMAGPWCSIMHRFLHEAHVDVENGILKAIKARFGLSQQHVHNVMFEVGFNF